MNLSKRNIFIVIFLAVLPCVSSPAEQHKRIVSLAPSITESIYQLGEEESLIGVTSYCIYPPEAKTKEIVGTLTNPNIEKIYSLSPDLVLATDGINQPQTIEKLKSLGLKVVVFGEYNDLDDVMKNFVQLGKLVGKEKRAKDVAEKVTQKLNFVKSELADLPRVRVFWEVGSRPLVTAGARSFADKLIRHCGGINIFADASLKYPRVSREEVLRRNPEVIVLVTMGDVTEEEKLYWRNFKDITAVKDNRIYVIDANTVCRPTPASFLTGLREVAGILHPEAFEKKESFE